MSGNRSNTRKQAQERQAAILVGGGTVVAKDLKPNMSKRGARWLQAHGHERFMASTGTISRKNPKVGRNDPCPCGQTIDGVPIKYKNCCGG